MAEPGTTGGAVMIGCAETESAPPAQVPELPRIEFCLFLSLSNATHHPQLSHHSNSCRINPVSYSS
jgi:hypothetical protein